MRTLVVGDIHGKRKLLERLLEECEYRAGEDHLILIGDLVDRGEDSRGVVDRAIQLQRDDPSRVTIVRGNHEDMMIEALAPSGGDGAELWYYNGGIETLESYLDQNQQIDVPTEHLDFLSSLPTWHEDEHAIYVHAALVEDVEGSFLHPRETPDDPELFWSRNRRFFSEYNGKTVVFGHTITGMIFGDFEKVWMREHLIGVDTGAYLTGVLSAVELPSRRVYNVRQVSGATAQVPESQRRFWR